MSEHDDNSRKILTREAVLFLWLFLAGLLLLPAAVYFIGSRLFGVEAGAGFGGFYGGFQSELWSGAPAMWFLVLSPYLVWQILRATLCAFHAMGRRTT